MSRIRKRSIWETLVAVLSGDHFLSPGFHSVYYRHDAEWGMHVFECPGVNWSTTVSDRVTKSTAWEIAQHRMSTGLF